MGISILMYHHVTRDARHDGRRPLPLAVFEMQMEYLAQNGFRVLSLDEAVNLHRLGRTAGQRSVVLTFDDGYGTTCDYAEAVLERYSYPATLFVTTEWVGVPQPHEATLTWDRVRSFRQLRVQAHTANHPRLTTVDVARIRLEVGRCKDTLQHELGRAVSHFAYPYGSYNAAARAAVGSAGFASACTVDTGPTRPGDDLFRLHRTAIDAHDSVDSFIRKVWTGFGSPLEQTLCGARDVLCRLPRVHDLLEQVEARRK